MCGTDPDAGDDLGGGGRPHADAGDLPEMSTPTPSWPQATTRQRLSIRSSPSCVTHTGDARGCSRSSTDPGGKAAKCAAGGRPVDVEDVVDAGVERGDHEGMAVVIGEAEVADGRSVDDAADERRIVAAALGFASQPGDDRSWTTLRRPRPRAGELRRSRDQRSRRQRSRPRPRCAVAPVRCGACTGRRSARRQRPTGWRY